MKLYINNKIVYYNKKFYIQDNNVNSINKNNLYYIIDFILNTNLIEIKKEYYNKLKIVYNKIEILKDRIFPILYYELYQILYIIYTEYNLENNEYYNYYLRKRIVFEKISLNGIYFNNNIEYPTFNLNVNKVGRVSMKIKNINLMNIKKTDDKKKLFESRFEEGSLYQFDYDCFHPRIIMNFLNKQIPSNKRGHKYLASIMFNKKYEDITDEEVNSFKLKFFKFIYGNYEINEDIFIHINNNKENILNNKTVLNRSQKNIGKNTFNYFILKNEIDTIILVLEKLFKYIEDNNLKTKIFMYQYDALFFDIPKEEENKINIFKSIMELNEQYKVNVKKSKNLFFN